MLGLGKEVVNHPVHRRGAVGDDENLARSGDQVDAGLAEHLALGLRHPRAAGADDLVYGADGFGAEGERRHRMGTAYRVGLPNVRPVQRGQRQRIGPAGTGHDGDDVPHASDRSGQRGHQHRRGIGRLASRHIDAHPIQGRHPLAKFIAEFICIGPGRP